MEEEGSEGAATAEGAAEAERAVERVVEAAGRPCRVGMVEAPDLGRVSAAALVAGATVVAATEEVVTGSDGGS